MSPSQLTSDTAFRAFSLHVLHGCLSEHTPVGDAGTCRAVSFCASSSKIVGLRASSGVVLSASRASPLVTGVLFPGDESPL